MSPKAIRRLLIGLELFVGVMAVYGGINLLADATGFGVKEEWLHGSPFSDYQVPALGLLVFVAGGNLLASALVWARREAGPLLSLVAGLGLMGFEVVETYSFGLRNVQQPLMFIVGLVIAGLGVMWWRLATPHETRRTRSTSWT
jgi:hypothetical protein